MVKKKSYNPFKMLGAWVGAVIGIFLGLSINVLSELNKILDIIGEGVGDLSTIGLDFFGLPIILLFFGFLLGWGIHSLIRFIRSKN